MWHVGREQLFFQLAILTIMAVVAVIVGVATLLIRIGVPDPFIHAFLMLGAVALLYEIAPAIATKCQKLARHSEQRR